jgi:hypothetical protein
MSVYGLDDAAEELPSHIQEQLHNLHRLDAELAHLESKLNETRKKRDLIHHQLKKFCELRAPIRQVPYEVLVNIFDSHPEDQSNRNSTLMRVCKLWYRIVIHTPKLWNHISLNLRKIDDLTLLWSYARTCLVYSRSLPLHIHLDAQNFYTEHNFSDVGWDFTHHFRHRYTYKRHTNAGRTLSAFIDEERRMDIGVNVYDSALLMTLAILRGEGDCFLKKWSSFHCYICLPYDEHEAAAAVGTRIWDSIDGTPENLVDLKIMAGDSRNIGWHPTGFPNLNSLKGFSIRLGVSLKRLGLPVATLERLILLDDAASKSLLAFTTGTFVALQLLQLEIRDPVDLDSMQAIHLPALKALALRKAGCRSIVRRLVAPVLTHLSFYSIYPSEVEVASTPNTVTNIMWTSLEGHLSTEVAKFLASLPSLKRIHVRRDEGATQTILTLRPDVFCTSDPTEWPYIIPLGGY